VETFAAIFCARRAISSSRWGPGACFRAGWRENHLPAERWKWAASGGLFAGRAHCLLGRSLWLRNQRRDCEPQAAKCRALASAVGASSCSARQSAGATDARWRALSCGATSGPARGQRERERERPQPQSRRLSCGRASEGAACLPWAGVRLGAGRAGGHCAKARRAAGPLI